jgi:hypothetical protein
VSEVARCSCSKVAVSCIEVGARATSMRRLEPSGGRGLTCVKARSACGALPAVYTLVPSDGRDRASLMSQCTPPADARLAEFMRYWADFLAQRTLRSHQITLHIMRAEIGNYLGMTLETANRADKVIGFAEEDRRDVRIPDVERLPLSPIAACHRRRRCRAISPLGLAHVRSIGHFLSAWGLVQKLPSRHPVDVSTVDAAQTSSLSRTRDAFAIGSPTLMRTPALRIGVRPSVTFRPKRGPPSRRGASHLRPVMTQRERSIENPVSSLSTIESGGNLAIFWQPGHEGKKHLEPRVL